MSWGGHAVWLTLVVTSLFVQSRGFSFRSDIEQMKINKESSGAAKLNLSIDTAMYFFAADGNNHPYNYIDEYGRLAGFDIDLVKKVCSKANRRCKTILAESEQCVFTDPKMGIDYAGRGLMARWFDACPSSAITIDRKVEFDFSLPYLYAGAYFAVAPGNYKRFNPDAADYSNFTLIHVTGAPTNVQCLTRLDKKFGKVIIAQGMQEATSLMLEGKADVLFTPHHEVAGLWVLHKHKQLNCDDSGAGVMLKKGSHMRHWWNPAFRDMWNSGSFEKLCKEAAEKHGVAPKCLPPPEFASPELLSLMNAEDKLERTDEHLYTFVVRGASPAYSFINKQGELEGFTKDVMDEVCLRADKRCVLMLAQIPECIMRRDGKELAGRGLLEGWFDVCTGYYDTDERRNSWDFTAAYLVNNGNFKVAPGNPSGFDPKVKDCRSHSVVYTHGSICNGHCLNRLKMKFKKVTEVNTLRQAVEAVLSGEADVFFGTKLQETELLDTLPAKVHCEHVGTAMMVKKGSDIPSWWDPAFAEFHRSGAYNKLCEEKKKLYNFDFPCLPAPETDMEKTIRI